MHSRLPEPSADERAHSDQLLLRLRERSRRTGRCRSRNTWSVACTRRGSATTARARPSSAQAGDFVTAPELGDVFARCVVNAVQPVLAALGDEADFLELGGGSGAFAEAALKALAASGTMPRYYLILEPSADLRERQRERICR
jgi:hypothetical protein